MSPAAATAYTLEPAVEADFEALLALRLRAMRQSLSAIGRYDEQRARERLASGFAPEATQHIVVDGRRIGFLVLKRLTHALRLDHLYIDPDAQRRGVGGRVLDDICRRADAELLPVELCALKGSAANRFYLRHGFVPTGEGEWDIDYLREPATPNQRAVRGLWAAFQRRDWAAARALLADDMVSTWWASGERFAGADAYIRLQATYPEGWTIHLLEISPLQDGRILTLVRVDHPPQSFFCTAFFRVDDGRVQAVDEYWATLEPPPGWREDAAQPGRSRFDPLDDPRARTP